MTATRNDALIELDELSSELCPRHRTTKNAVELEPDAPERMRRVWEALGDSEATARLRVLRREESRAALERVFSDWAAEPRSLTAWNAKGDTKAYFDVLPARYRLVLARSDEVVITDETGTTDDPPVLVMRKTVSPIVTECASYVPWLIWELLRTVTVSRRSRYNRHSEIRGERVLCGLYPQMERLAEGVYWMAMPELLRTDVVPQSRSPIFYRTLGDYFRWVLGLSEDEIRFAWAPEEAMVFVISPPGPWDLWKQTPEGFRRFHPTDGVGKVQENAWEAVGRVGDVFLWLHLRKRSKELLVRFDLRKEDDVRAIVGQYELKIKDVQPMHEDYAKYGW